jgi:hypothetical protein
MAPEVLQKILIHATATSPIGLPKEWFNLVLSCRHFRDCLSCNSRKLFSTLFAQKFDISAPVRRLGEDVVQNSAKLEMQRRFNAMNIFRKRRLGDGSLTEAFWIAFLMCEDSGGSQKNIKQLLNASLPSFLELFLRERLYLGADTNNGWPFANERNSLAAALLWLMASSSTFLFIIFTIPSEHLCLSLDQCRESRCAGQSPRASESLYFCPFSRKLIIYSPSVRQFK